MTDTFAPLVVPATARSAEGAIPAFKPFPSASRPASSAAAPVPATPAAHHSSGRPKITLQRDGDRVTHIRIECGCGEVIELACVH